ncbi:MAG TPA: terminase family protein [Rhizomicrobium sp.]|jgi:phage terminase large subunit-like protein
MSIRAQRLSCSQINALPPNERDEFFAQLSEEQAAFLIEDWGYWARDEQLPPDGDWRIWLFLGGRGSGKTRAGAEWIAEGIRNGTMRRIALIGATYAETRAVMIEGESGLLSVSSGVAYESSNRRIIWPGGAKATVLSADEPDSIRGHQFDAAWADEFCKWPDPQGALDMLLMALRLGADPRLCVTTTPRAIAPLIKLIEARDTALTHSTTADNAANLAPGFVDALEQRYGGTRLGRQELDGDLIEDNELALWRRDWIERARLRAPPSGLVRVVVAVDPPASVGGAECGIVVAGADGEGQYYVLADRSLGGLTATQWAARATSVFAEFKADRIVAEANQGGEMVMSLLRQAKSNAPVLLAHATRDKRTRATPVSALYEQGRVHHVGLMPELEDQMCQFDGKGSSPDRMDALVWALSHLSEQGGAEPRVRSA